MSIRQTEECKGILVVFVQDMAIDIVTAYITEMIANCVHQFTHSSTADSHST